MQIASDPDLDSPPTGKARIKTAFQQQAPLPPLPARQPSQQRLPSGGNQSASRYEQQAEQVYGFAWKVRCATSPVAVPAPASEANAACRTALQRSAADSTCCCACVSTVARFQQSLWQVRQQHCHSSSQDSLPATIGRQWHAHHVTAGACKHTMMCSTVIAVTAAENNGDMEGCSAAAGCAMRS